jgi:hypothetical protein
MLYPKREHRNCASVEQPNMNKLPAEDAHGQHHIWAHNPPDWDAETVQRLASNVGVVWYGGIWPFDPSTQWSEKTNTRIECEHAWPKQKLPPHETAMAQSIGCWSSNKVDTTAGQTGQGLTDRECWAKSQGQVL